MNQTEFEVIRFTNRNGTTSWRVTGWLHGLRIRKNFQTREEAAAEKSVFEVKAAQTARGMRTVATSLTIEQIREAEAVFQRLRSTPCPLSFYVDFALSNYKEPDQQKKLAAACADYVAAKQRELEQDQLSTAQMRHIRWEMKRLPPAMSDLAQGITKDPYLFDFLAMRDDVNERPSKKGLLGK